MKCENNKNTSKNMKDSKFLHFMRTSPLRNWPLYHRVRFARKVKKMRKSVTRRGYDFDKLRPLLLESMVKYHWDTDEFFIFMQTSPQSSVIRLFPNTKRTFFVTK